MRNRKKRSFEQRLAKADSDGMAVLDMFEQVAESLETAAQESASVKTEVEDQVLHLREIRDKAYRTEVAYAAKAQKIREFFQ